ncbi:MAG: hypothetical protein V7677_11740 [Motiliproteus sp.]
MTAAMLHSARHNSRLLTLILLLTLSVLLSGCQQQMLLPQPFRTDSLDNWMSQELTPYLQQQISQHPRFKGQRLKVVKMNGQQLATDMDQLTATLRDQINSTLVSLPESNLVWQANAEANSATVLQCNQTQAIDYLIAIESQLDVNQQLSVSVRALDMHDQMWVNGFGKNWQGRINNQQKKALQTVSSDQTLRGQRVLPFEPHQGDVIARELAHQLSCKLLKQQDEPVRVYIPNTHQDPFIAANFKLLGHYMAQFKEATLTHKPKQAQLLIDAELQPIDNDLNQLWISAKAPDGSTQAGLTAKTYIRLAPLAQRLKTTADTRLVKTSVPKKSPPSTTLEVIPVVEKSSKKPFVGATTRANTSTLFTRVVVPKRQQFCRGRNPWRQGERYQAAGPQQQVDDCFALEMEVPSGYQAFLIREDSDGTLLRLAPDSCRGLVRFVDRRAGTDTLRFPPKHGRGKSTALRTGNMPSTFYALAIKPGHMAQQLRQHITRLPGQCLQQKGRSLSGPKAATWLSELRRLSRADDDFIWQAQVIRPAHNDPQRPTHRNHYPDTGEMATY